METTHDFVFTRRPDMYEEHTFYFSAWDGAITFSHSWNLRCYNFWGEYSGSGSEANILLPYDTQLKVSGTWGKQNFGRLYIEVMEVTSTSIKVKYWVKVYHPGEWYSGLSYVGTLRCFTGGEEPLETVKSYSDDTYSVEKDVFDYEETVYVEATDGITSGGTPLLRVLSDSADLLLIRMTEGPSTKYRCTFVVTKGQTNGADVRRIHLDPGEKGLLVSDVNYDTEMATHAIYCEEQPEEPEVTEATHYQIQVNTQVDMLGTMMWDSQKCSFATPVAVDTRCPDIEYAGTKLDLSGNTTYWWRIKFWTNEGATAGLWSTEVAYFRGTAVIPDGLDGVVRPEPGTPEHEEMVEHYMAQYREPTGRAEVELVANSEEWTDLADVMSIVVSNNKNPLDNIETTQGTIYLSNIDKKFYSANEASEFYDKLTGRKVRMSLGIYEDDVATRFRKMLGIVKSVNVNRRAMTAEIVALEFLDYYKTRKIRQTPVYQDLSVFELFCELVTYCFPNWKNQTETPDWDYYVAQLGFRRSNVYLGVGNGGADYVIQNHSKTPAEIVYNIIACTEVIYKNGVSLIKGTDFSISQDNTQNGVRSTLHFLKDNPISADVLYGCFTIETRVEAVQYKDTDLITELEKIALVADCRIFADVSGHLVCKSNAPASVYDNILHDKHLMELSSRRDIDGIVNHVIVESKPYIIAGEGTGVGSWDVEFGTKGEAGKGEEHTFDFEEFTTELYFDISWSLECSNVWGTYFGSGSEENFTLPLNVLVGVKNMWGSQNYGRLHIETVEVDSLHVVVKLWLECFHPKEWYSGIDFDATLSVKGVQIGQPITYTGEAIDEVSFHEMWIGEKPQTFTLEYLEPGTEFAQQAAESLLSILGKLKTYYDCGIRGLAYLRLLDTVTITEPTASLDAKEMQVIKLVDSLKIGDYRTNLGLMIKEVPVVATPAYWTPEWHTFEMSSSAQTSQTYKWTFRSEMIGYSFRHKWDADLMGNVPDASGEHEDLSLPFSEDIQVAKSDGELLTLGTLDITLVAETATSVEINYKFTLADGWKWGTWWPHGWWNGIAAFIGELACIPEFSYEAGGPAALPHYPDTHPNIPPDEQPTNGYYYDTPDWPSIAWPWTPGASEATVRSQFQTFLDMGINAFVSYHHIEDYRDSSSATDWYDMVYNVAAEMGMKVIWYTGVHRLHYKGAKTGEGFVQRYSKFAACGGFTYGDEPNYMGWDHAGCKWAVDEAHRQGASPSRTPMFAVFGYDLSVNYNTCYTPGSEIFDVGCADCYPTALAGSGWKSFLEYWVNHSYHRPNNDGFGDCGKGMIPVIQAHVESASSKHGAMVPDLVGEYNVWKAKYGGQLKGIGFYLPYAGGDAVGFLESGSVAANLRNQIKKVARLTGWVTV